MRTLTDDERRLVILIKLYQKEHRQGPLWSWLREQTGMNRAELRRAMLKLRRHRAVIFSNHTPHSTIATKQGVAAALKHETPLDGTLAED